MAIIKDKIKEFNSSETIIVQDCIFTGNITTKGILRIEGTVEGNINEAKEIFITKTARINGDISAEKAIIYGKITGNIFVNGSTEIMSTAEIEGDISTSKIMIEEGAKVNGKINMKEHNKE